MAVPPFCATLLSSVASTLEPKPTAKVLTSGAWPRSEVTTATGSLQVDWPSVISRM